MSDDAGLIELGLTDDADPVVLLPSGQQAATLAAVLQELPNLQSPAHAMELATAVNHLAQGSDFRVIADPAAFERTFRARLAQEDTKAEWDENTARLGDFGVPDFAEIQPPRLAGQQLVFFATDIDPGLPYQVEATLPDGEPEYEALSLTPVAEPEGPAPEPELNPPLAEELEARRSASAQEQDEE